MKKWQRLQKPQLQHGGPISSNPASLGGEAKRHLVALVGQHVPDAAEFVDECVQLADIVRTAKVAVTARHQRDQLLLLAEGARATLKALQRLSRDSLGTAHAQEMVLALGLDEQYAWPVLSDSLRQAVSEYGVLQISWEILEAVEATARLAVAEIDTSKRTSPEIHAGEALASHVVNAYVRRCRGLPSANQEGWFVSFVATLGEYIGVQSGPRPVRRAIELATITRSS